MPVNIRTSMDGIRWFDSTHEMNDIIKDAYTLQPFMVATQDEKDYLDGLFLISGKSPAVLIEDPYANPFDVPPTYIRIDL